MSAKIRFVTDSTADLPPEFVERYNITVVPLKVSFGEETYRDYVDIKPDVYYRRLRSADKLPRTSQPSPADFLAAYRPLVEEGAEIISIHIASALSGTVQAARLAKSMLNYPHLDVVDSQSASIFLQGGSVQEILELWQSFESRRQVLFMVDSMEYMLKGGRIGKGTAFLGTLLNIKPILTFKGGVVHPVEKVRGRKKALERMVELARRALGEDTPVHCIIAHADAPDYLEELRRRVEDRINYTELIISRMGPVMGTYSGPGFVGIVVWRDA
jgi:DegV family protein with EDD domain